MATSALESALSGLAGVAVALLKTELDANEPALTAAAQKAGSSLITAVATKITSALPTNGIIANVEKSELDPIITNVATQVVAQLPTGVNYLETIVDDELAQLEKNLTG